MTFRTYPLLFYFSNPCKQIFSYSPCMLIFPPQESFIPCACVHNLTFGVRSGPNHGWELSSPAFSVKSWPNHGWELSSPACSVRSGPNHGWELSSPAFCVRSGPIHGWELYSPAFSVRSGPKHGWKLSSHAFSVRSGPNHEWELSSPVFICYKYFQSESTRLALIKKTNSNAFFYRQT